tara:strand:- start:633 stop:1100 length:468 start_codon:yes stop_codon:yes gene_type:complete
MHITSLFLGMLSGLFFSLSVILNKYHLLKFFKPHELVIFRRSIYPLFLIILLICAPKTYGKLKKMPRKIAFQTFLTVIFGFLGLIIFLYVLLKNKTSGSVSIRQSSIILFSILISHLFYGEKVNAAELGGILFILVGIIVIGFNKNIMELINNFS